jgi:D-lactate dehydrogenase
VQVLITPHSAFLTQEALQNISDVTIQNLTNHALGQPLGSNEVRYQVRGVARACCCV